MKCKHDHQVPAGESIWCEECGSFKLDKDTDWMRPTGELPELSKEIIENQRALIADHEEIQREAQALMLVAWEGMKLGQKRKFQQACEKFGIVPPEKV